MSGGRFREAICGWLAVAMILAIFSSAQGHSTLARRPVLRRLPPITEVAAARPAKLLTAASSSRGAAAVSPLAVDGVPDFVPAEKLNLKLQSAPAAMLNLGGFLEGGLRTGVEF